MNEWKEILKQDETFQDTRINIKPAGASGRNLSSKDKEALIDCMEKILEEPGVNPKLKWFARQPFEGKVITCYANKQTQRRGSGTALKPARLSSGSHISWQAIHRLLIEEFGARIDGANDANCGKNGRLGKYGGKCGGSMAHGDGSSVIIYQQHATQIFGPPDPVPKPKPEPKPKPKPKPKPEPEPEPASSGKTIMTQYGAIPASDDWKENLKRLQALKRKKKPRRKYGRGSKAGRRGGESGYGGALLGQSMPSWGNTPTICEQCGHNRAKRNMTRSETGANICKHCAASNKKAKQEGTTIHGAGHEVSGHGRDRQKGEKGNR